MSDLTSAIDLSVEYRDGIQLHCAEVYPVYSAFHQGWLVYVTQALLDGVTHLDCNVNTIKCLVLLNLKKKI